MVYTKNNAVPSKMWMLLTKLTDCIKNLFQPIYDLIVSYSFIRVDVQAFDDGSILLFISSRRLQQGTALECRFVFETTELPHKSSILEDGIWTDKIGKVLNVSYSGFSVWISDLGTPKTMLLQVGVMDLLRC